MKNKVLICLLGTVHRALCSGLKQYAVTFSGYTYDRSTLTSVSITNCLSCPPLFDSPSGIIWHQCQLTLGGNCWTPPLPLLKIYWICNFPWPPSPSTWGTTRHLLCRRWERSWQTREVKTNRGLMVDNGRHDNTMTHLIGWYIVRDGISRNKTPLRQYTQVKWRYLVYILLKGTR